MAKQIPSGQDDVSRLPAFVWLARGDVRRVVAALEAVRPDAVRFVGGCVRDSLLGRVGSDIDIATELTPDETVAALKAARIKAVPTGAAHGTITAVIGGKPFEVTSLRADVETDGRRAVVAFTRDWNKDWVRRDFTINAIYLTPGGKLWDPTGGLDDLATGAVRFIGDARARIREDYLRILRFYRFSARFTSEIDAVGQAACAELHAGVGGLSAERVGAEMLKVLAEARAGVVLRAMATADVLAQVWPDAPDIDAVERASEREPLLRLAALFPQADEALDARLRLSRAQGARRRKALAVARRLAPDMTPHAVRILKYEVGDAAVRDGVALAQARALAGDWTALKAVPAPPAFPLGGADVLAAGVARGESVGRVLRAVEADWIAADFPADAAWLRERLAFHAAKA